MGKIGKAVLLLDGDRKGARNNVRLAPQGESVYTALVKVGCRRKSGLDFQQELLSSPTN